LDAIGAQPGILTSESEAVDDASVERGRMEAELGKLSRRLDAELAERASIVEAAGSRAKEERRALAEGAEQAIVQEVARREAECKILEERLAAVESHATRELEVLRDRLKGWKHEAVRAGTARDDALRQVDAHRRERDRLGDRCATAEADVVSLEARLRERTDEAEARADLLRNGRAEAERLVHELERAAERDQEGASQIAELAERVAQLEASLELGRLSAEFERRALEDVHALALRGRDADLAGLREEVDRLGRRDKELSGELDAAAGREASLRDQSEELASLLATERASRGELLRHRSEAANLSEELVRTREQLLSASREGDELRASLEGLRAELDGQRRAGVAARQQFNRELAELRDRLDRDSKRTAADLEAARLGHEREIWASSEEAARFGRAVDKLRRRRESQPINVGTTVDRGGGLPVKRRDPLAGPGSSSSMDSASEAEDPDDLYRDVALGHLGRRAALAEDPGIVVVATAGANVRATPGRATETSADPGREGEVRGDVGVGTVQGRPRAEADRLAEEVEDATWRGDLIGAEDAARRLVALSGILLGEGHPGFGAALCKLSGLLFLRGDLEGAGGLLDRATSICLGTMGDRSPAYAAILRNRAMLLRSGGDEVGALRLAREAEVILSAAEYGPLGLMHSTVACAGVGGHR
jgi:hypothetical protein